MADSQCTHHGHSNGSFMEGIEEGPLDKTDKTIQEKSTAFPRTVEHSWKDFVSDPSHSEIEIFDNSKTLESPMKIGHKDWDHYLSAFSLNDEDVTKFKALEIHTDDIQEDLCTVNAADFKDKENFDTGNISGAGTGQLPSSQMSLDVDWQRLTQFGQRSPNAQWQTEPSIQPNSLPARQATQASVEERKKLPVDVNNISDVMILPQDLSLTNSCLLEQRNISGADSDVVKHAAGMSRMVGKEGFKDYPHLAGDGMKSDDDMKGNSDVSDQQKETSNGDTNLEFKKSDQCATGNLCDQSDSNTERDSESRLNTNSSDTKPMSSSDHIECTTNVETSREAAENLPVRPLTIGNSLTIGSTLAYRPISPFQPHLYPISTAISAPMVPSSSSIFGTSPSQYSEEMLEEESGDMSARERLQPLGRDGLEVKQGPPWGITMPLFQPDSRNSSLSSNDSSTNNTQLFDAQTTSNQQQIQLETEPLQSISSTPSEADLSRKISIKSLEPKEPIGIKTMSGKTQIGKFHQQNPADADSPVSKILGPTFKTTQKMLEELQRRPLGAYDEDSEQLSVHSEHKKTDSYERESSVEKERPIERSPHSDSKPNRIYGGIENAKSGRERSNHNINSGHKINGVTRDSCHDVSINKQPNELTLTTTADVEDPLEDRAIPKKDFVGEFLTNQQTPDLTTITSTHRAVLNDRSNMVTDGLLARHVSRRFSNEKDTKIATKDGSENETKLGSTPITIASTTQSPVASVKDSIPQRVDRNFQGSPSMGNENRKTQQTSGLTDSTLGNSVGLSDHSDFTKVETKGAECAEPEGSNSNNLLAKRLDVSDLSEFDRVASASISWSNAVANQFRQEMKSLKFKVQGGFLDNEQDEISVNEQGATTSIVDSGLSESSTNDEIYRPKQLVRLSAGNGPVGIYDVRQSSGPGSSNRKRLALGKKPRESSKSLRKGDIYVSDETMGTSSTDRDNQNYKTRHTVHGGVYVSAATSSGTESVDNGINSGPEGQSTPISVDTSTRKSNAHKSSGICPKEGSRTDIYLGLTKVEKPKRSRSDFTSYELETPAELSPSAFINYRSFQQEPSFSTFEIDKPRRENVSRTSRNEVVINRGENVPNPQQGSSVTQPAAQVEHTWSISKPVMSQLSTKSPPLLIHGVYPEPRITTQQQSFTQTDHPAHQRSTKHRKSIPKPVHVKNRAPSGMESEKKKKSVADIILENMIQQEQEQKKRHEKLEVKQKQTSQDLNQLWQRFQDVFGKKSKSSRRNKTSQRSYHDTTSTDISMASSSGTEKTNIGRQSIDISTDSDEEFERFLRRIQEMKSSESSDQENSLSKSSRSSSSHQRMAGHDQSETTSLRRKHRYNVVDSSSSMLSAASSDDDRIRLANRQRVVGPIITERKSETAVSLPMWLSVKNAEMMKQRKTSDSCTCGAKSRKETKKSISVRDIGINCPTPPIVAQELIPVATDIAVLRTGSSEEHITNSASLVKLSLQDAFLHSQQQFIERSSERVQKIQEKRDQRQISGKTTQVVIMPSEKTKPRKENKKHDDNMVFHTGSNKQFGNYPLTFASLRSEQLQRKKPRPMSTKEIRDINKRTYKNLPEVKKKRDEERRAEFYKTNRLRAQLYGKHVRNTNRIFTAA